MQMLIDLLPQVRQGAVVTQTRMNGEAKFFEKDGEFVCQCGNGEPHPYSLDWRDLTELEWQVV